MTLRGFGVHKLRGTGRGDLVVHVEVVTPTRLSQEEQDLLRKFSKMRGEKLSTFKVHHRNKEHNEHGLFGRVRDAFNR